MKRAGIYFFYDKDGIVDSYVPYFINGLHEVVDYIVVVVNGTLNAEGRKILSSCADDLFVRENIGFDAWAYKEAIEYIGWDDLLQFDELVLANFTIFGPVYPFKEIFEQMEKAECDFWGMSISYEKDAKNWYGIPLKWNCIPEVVISNFHVYKKSVLHSFEFRMHWDTLPKIKNYFESNVFHEMEISKMLTDAGFIMAAADQGAFRNKCPSPSVFGAFDALVQYRVPVIRVKAFYDPNGRIDFCSDIPEKIIRYLNKETTYDVNLIWEHLLRINNQYDLKNWFNWNRILPKDWTSELLVKNNIAVIYYVCHIENINEHLKNIIAFPAGTNFYFLTDTEENQRVLQKLLQPYSENFGFEYRLVEDRGALETLLAECYDIVLEKSYDFICFLNEKKVEENSSQFFFVEQEFIDSCFENIVPSTEYISNIIQLFMNEPRLGVIVPPPPKNERYYRLVHESWRGNYRNVINFLKSLELYIPTDPQKPPIVPYGCSFWFRPEALFPLYKRNWKYEDFEIERRKKTSEILKHSLPLIAQAQGFYPTIVMNPSYASGEITRMTETAYTYIDFTLRYVGAKSSLQIATRQFAQMLQEGSKNAAVKDLVESSQETLLYPNRPKNILKKFLYKSCPIGLWDFFCGAKCFLKGETYIREKTKRNFIKSFVRGCTPRFLWDQLRKMKCRRNGWVFVDSI